MYPRRQPWKTKTKTKRKQKQKPSRCQARWFLRTQKFLAEIVDSIKCICVWIILVWDCNPESPKPLRFFIDNEINNGSKYIVSLKKSQISGIPLTKNRRFVLRGVTQNGVFAMWVLTRGCPAERMSRGPCVFLGKMSLRSLCLGFLAFCFVFLLFFVFYVVFNWEKYLTSFWLDFQTFLFFLFFWSFFSGYDAQRCRSLPGIKTKPQARGGEGGG